MLKHHSWYLFTCQDLCGVSGVDITLVEDHGEDIIKNASKFFFITNLFIKVLT
jgi:hypothetical protein